jgi:two-component sensor histidine kinase
VALAGAPAAERRAPRHHAAEPAAGGVELTAADDGIGFSDGFGLGPSSSMGLQLAASLAGQLGGQLQIRPGRGAHFSAVLTRL